MYTNVGRYVRIGCIKGRSPKVNERAIDDSWTGYLGQYADLVRIPPIRFAKCFGGSLRSWARNVTESLPAAAGELARLTREYGVSLLYVNAPAFIPYLLMARNYAKLDVGLLFIAHSVGSAYWLKQWLSIAPWIGAKDVLLASTESSRQALLRLSGRYELANRIPLCIDTAARSEADFREREGNRLLAIGRIEDVKNVHVLLRCFAEAKRRVPEAVLTVAGAYTGSSADRIDEYRRRLEGIAAERGLGDSVVFAGPVEGEAKERLFRESDVLVNLSTDPGETFGYNLLEAKAWGLPALCTYWDGFAELVEHGRDGLFASVDWSGDRPVIREEEAVEHCVRLLRDRALRERMSREARASAGEFDYRAAMPRIVSLLEKAQANPIGADEDTLSVLSTPLARLGHLYELDRLSPFGCLDRTPLSILEWETTDRLEEWMPKAKPVIHHFAGRVEHARV
ncbi:hypothetical protein J19TS2_32830 [Cohnella xylanilytica]|uniref:Glycosyltransferase family 4 protein n=1 Tax=Cohnella xylanilytica TaxID=557555 RepID=A0A841TVD9_9BACL|nr:glycosyltransferase family 4 protein [Cohnella xylanilytica]MBB6690922.1 glycosyltransferase family 4 protein [Cohnella xylanilytica]GIO13728.1 hypothetical protein J19TS2_32830 [Cohnella xylanilytica]